MTGLLAKFLPYLDFFWVPLALVIVHPEQRIKAVIYALCCAFVLRLQVEFMEQIGYPRGIFALWNWPLLYRGMGGYAAAMAVYLLVARLSPRTDLFIMMAASIAIFIGAFCVTSLLMVL